MSRETIDENGVDLEALAEAYERGLALEKSGDQSGAAEAYRQVLALDRFDRAGASVRLAAMGAGETPDKAPDAYVAILFDQHAEVFDNILVEQLGYDAPLQLREMLIARAGAEAPRFARMLDLGCGTGLCGEALEEFTETRIGVDISEEMVAIASEKEVYDELFVGEGVAFTECDAAREAEFDLVAATDMLPYLGDLRDLFDGVSTRLKRGGLFAFSSETLPDAAFAGASYKVGEKHRFAHHPSYVEAALTKAGMALLERADIIVRYDEGDPILGHLYIAEKN